MKVKKIVNGAMIGGIYAALTILLAPISYGMIQVRISEALCVLPMFTPSAIPGLFIGCLIANLFYGNIFDIIFGSLATLIAALLGYRFRKNKFLVPLFPVLSNALIVGAYMYKLTGVEFTWGYYAVSAFWVGLGELVACYGFGGLLISYLSKNNIFERIEK